VIPIPRGLPANVDIAEADLVRPDLKLHTPEGPRPRGHCIAAVEPP
jgi:hypothetical protein